MMILDSGLLFLGKKVSHC